MVEPQRIAIMGATGSIGRSALDVIAHANAAADGAPRFEVTVLASRRDVDGLAALARLHRPELTVIAEASLGGALSEALEGTGLASASGREAVVEAASRPCDKLLAAISGSAGLASTLAAVRAGTTVALANKESIVCAGALLLDTAQRCGATVLPVDSEHNAIFQVWQDGRSVERLTITASGGPFRTASQEAMARATPAEARAHPNWDMGLKNSIDSATLMNKALEFIEASYLFGLEADAIDVLVHPQSIVHGMVHYVDGSVLAQLGMPDMRTPIAHTLAWPERIATGVPRLDLAQMGHLDFGPVDSARFPAVDYARAASRMGNGAATLLNSANEVAVEAYVAGKCGFLDISWVVGEMLDRYPGSDLAAVGCKSLDDIAYLDSRAREIASQLLAKARFRAGD